MSDASVPPGWPSQVPPPDSPGWERRACGWLFDLCPADLRAHEVLGRHPAVLAYVAVGQVDAALAATRTAIASARADLRGLVEPAVVGEVVAALQSEEARLTTAARQVRLVAEALRGVRHRPAL